MGKIEQITVIPFIRNNAHKVLIEVSANACRNTL